MPPERRDPLPEVVPVEVTRESVAPESTTSAPIEPPASVTRPAGAAVSSGPSSRQLLRRALSSPGSARQGFLLREVLGPPVSLRADVDGRPR